MPTHAQAPAVPRLTYLRIKNYRALRDVEFRDLTPLTVLIGPNGSGKSTVLDALDFLAEAVGGHLKNAWEKRNRLAGIQTRGIDGGISFELEADLSDELQAKYYVSFYEIEGKPLIVNESIRINKGEQVVFSLANENKEPVRMLNIDSTLADFINLYPNDRTSRPSSQLASASWLTALSTSWTPDYGLLNPLSSLLTSYRYVHLTDDHLKGYSDAGPREKLSPNGDNLPNVLYYLHTKHPETLAKITAQMRRWVPGLADIVPEITSDERLLLRFKDAPFEKPLPAQYMSDGTMRLAALLTLLYEPDAAGLLGIEEPENELHPRLLHRLAEELIKATETRQLLVATHSPYLLDAFEPEQVWVLHRGPDGYTQATRTADIPNVKELVEDGSPLGYLWTSNSFTVGDPLASSSTTAPDAR